MHVLLHSSTLYTCMASVDGAPDHWTWLRVFHYKAMLQNEALTALAIFSSASSADRPLLGLDVVMGRFAQPHHDHLLNILSILQCM